MNSASNVRAGLLCSLAILAACSQNTAVPQPPRTADSTSSTAGQRPVDETASASNAAVTVHPARAFATISKYLLGGNLVQWYNPTISGLPAALKGIGLTAARWPGGSQSDQYHWQDDSICGDGYVDPNAHFDNFMTKVAKPAGLDIAITLNYGSDHACTGGGDPAEAAAWVAHAKAENDGITHWTVGNEVYGSWEYDKHAKPHDPATYAAAVANSYYPQIKAADANALVGVVVEGYGNWDPTVLANAKYDFVELHWYVQSPGQESDADLLAKGGLTILDAVHTIQQELKTAGHAGTPIYLGELGSVSGNPGKQTQSITQALFAGITLGYLTQAGVARATWWTAYGGCSDSTTGNFSSSLYGWQNFGGYTMLSDGEPEASCPNAQTVAADTPLPTARAFQVMSGFIHQGEKALDLSIDSNDYPHVRAFGATNAGGYSVALFNLDAGAPVTVKVGIDGLGAGSGATMTTYGRAQYDNVKQNVWTGPVTKKLGAWSGALPVTLPEWSMSVVTFPPPGH